jgi:branched-subunit amino acid transport protein
VTGLVGWATILSCALLCYATKFAGLSVPRAVLERPSVRRAAELLPVALLAALIAVGTFAAGREVVLDTRVAGLAAAVVALLRRAPFLVVVVVAAATTALLRLV